MIDDVTISESIGHKNPSNRRSTSTLSGITLLNSSLFITRLPYGGVLSIVIKDSDNPTSKRENIKTMCIHTSRLNTQILENYFITTHKRCIALLSLFLGMESERSLTSCFDTESVWTVNAEYLRRGKALNLLWFIFTLSFGDRRAPYTHTNLLSGAPFLYSDRSTPAASLFRVEDRSVDEILRTVRLAEEYYVLSYVWDFF